MFAKRIEANTKNQQLANCCIWVAGRSKESIMKTVSHCLTLLGVGAKEVWSRTLYNWPNHNRTIPIEKDLKQKKTKRRQGTKSYQESQAAGTMFSQKEKSLSNKN